MPGQTRSPRSVAVLLLLSVLLLLTLAWPLTGQDPLPQPPAAPPTPVAPTAPSTPDLPPNVAATQPQAPRLLPVRVAPHHVLVKLQSQANLPAFLSQARQQGLRENGFVYGTRWLRMQIPPGRNPRQAAADARALPGVEQAAADPLVRINDTIPCDPYCRDDDDPSLEPCDPLFDEDCDASQLVDQWGLFQVGAPQAWDVERGDPSVVIAVIDSGVDLDHDDLYGNIWANPDDPADGIDNDNNGFVDDVHGADFCGDNDGDPVSNDPASQDPNPDIPEGGYWDFGEQYVPFEVAWIGDPAVGDAVDNDGDGLAIDLGVFHGTFVAGIAGAMTNNLNPDTGECDRTARRSPPLSCRASWG